jgi:hypothetical protein
MDNPMLERLCRLLLLSVLLVAGVVGATQNAKANGASLGHSSKESALRDQPQLSPPVLQPRPREGKGSEGAVSRQGRPGLPST